MPYISPERVKAIRNRIKKEFPEYKFSIRGEHYSSVNVTILSGPIDLIVGDHGVRYGHEQVNHFYIKDHYSKFPAVRDVLQKIYEIMNEGNYTEVMDGDYGAVPSFYCHISVGAYDRPYEVNVDAHRKSVSI